MKLKSGQSGQAGPNWAILGQMGPSRTKRGQNGAKMGPNRVKYGQGGHTGPNKAKWGQTRHERIFLLQEIIMRNIVTDS